MKTRVWAFGAVLTFIGLAGCSTSTTTGSSGGLTPAASTSPSRAADRATVSGAAQAATSQAVGQAATTKSAKRGVAYDFSSQPDLGALASGVSWWYNWGAGKNNGISSTFASQNHLDYYPMLWNDNFNDAQIVTYLKANSTIKYLMVLNEPNLGGQAYLTPQQAAQVWPRYESIAQQTGVKIVGPQITWGNMPNYADPVVWMDAFYAAYQTNNGGRSPRIDYLGFHWYDYGLDGQLNRLTKYGKHFWVTEFANWHSQNDGAQIDTLAKQEAQMKSMVATLEGRSDVFRYAWFTGRLNSDPHYDSLLSGTGQLTDLGREYISLPVGPAVSQ